MNRYLRGTFASLAVRNYRLFFLGQAVSVTGVWMQRLALAWLVLEVTDSGTWLGIVIAATQLPTLFLGAYGGLLADRYDKRVMLMWIALVGAVPSVALGVMAMIPGIDVVPILIAALLLGLVDCFERPARQSFPSDLVGNALLPNAVTLNQIIQDIGRSIGPAIAAVTIAVLGVPATFFINAASFGAVIVALYLMRPAELTPQERSARQRGEVREGLAYVRRNPHLLGPVLLLFAVGTVAYNHQVHIPLLARDTFSGDAQHAGLLLAALGLGAVLGGLSLAGVLKPSPRLIVVAAVLIGANFIALSLAPHFGVALLLAFTLGAASLTFKTLSSSWLQLVSSPVMRGRVVSVLIIAIAGTTPVGGPLVGWLAQELGTRASFAVAGALSMAAAGVVYLYLSRRNSLHLTMDNLPAEQRGTAAVLARDARA